MRSKRFHVPAISPLGPLHSLQPMPLRGSGRQKNSGEATGIIWGFLPDLTQIISIYIVLTHYQTSTVRSPSKNEDPRNLVVTRVLVVAPQGFEPWTKRL